MLKIYSFKKVVLFCILLFSSFVSFGQSAEEIIDNMDKTMIFDSAKIELRMVSSDRFGERTSTLIMYMKGSDNSLMEFTSKAERGQKVLQTKDEIYLFFPGSKKIRKIQGAAMKEGIAGSSVSYDDVMGNKSIKEDFNLKKLANTNFNGKDAFQIEMNEKPGKNKPYPKNIILIDKETYVPLKIDKFSINGKLLQSMTLEDIREVGGLHIAHKIFVQDALKKNSSTTIYYDNIDLNANINNRMFSLSELSW